MSKIHNLILRDFTQSPNAVITDQRLSDGAVRLFLYLCSKSGIDWAFNNSDIKKQLDIKRDETIAKYFRELIASGWISRSPRMRNGRPSGFYDYTLYYEPIANANTGKAELRNNVTPDKPDTVNPQLPKNSSLNNTEISNNKKNTPLPPKAENRVGAVWLQMAENLEFNFSNEEQAAISSWAEYQTNQQKNITTLQIEINLQNLFKLKTNGYDITSMINDTISAGYKWLLKPSTMYIKKAAITKPAKMIKPHLFGNPEYIIPENPTEKIQLTQYIQSCYKKRINPKNKQLLTIDEIHTLDLHHKLFMSQDKNTKGFFVTYASWADYILQNEVHTGIPLIDQSINDESLLPITTT